MTLSRNFTAHTGPVSHKAIGVVVVSAESGRLRRELRPLAWMALEEVAMTAVVEDGRLVARTSARRVAERLGVDPGTASNALRDLRRRGLVVLERESGPAGRFGLSVYVFNNVAGLCVVPEHGVLPCVEEPLMAKPHPDQPGVIVPNTVTPSEEAPSMEQPDYTCVNDEQSEALSRSPRILPSSLQDGGQVALDLGLGSP
jgi:DNA-binding transcriptional ArsR family regulator